MQKLDPTIVQKIKNKIAFLLYSQATTHSQPACYMPTALILSATEIIIWQQNNSCNDVYTINFASTPEYYAAAMEQAGQN